MSNYELEFQIREIIIYALKRRVNYEGFVKAIVKALYPNLSIYAEPELVRKLKALIELINNTEKPKTPYDVPIEEVKQIIANWKGSRYLVDDLGLPEIYEILRYSMQLGRNINLARILAFINPWGNTAAFKLAFDEGSMREIARNYVTDFIRGQDELVHEIFGKFMNIEDLISSMNNKLKTNIIHLIKHDLEIKDNDLLIMADHGYDIECGDIMCRLCHGNSCAKPIFSLITPLVIVR
jgi:hypothetical protein